MNSLEKYVDYHPIGFDEKEMNIRSKEFLKFHSKRRSLRDFSEREIPVEIMENLIMAGSSAPSGANKQPWTFCLIGDPEIKKRIRIEAEKEEYASYNGRMPKEWLEDLEPLGTNWEKPFLENAPWLVVVFKRAYENIDGKVRKNYYVNESVGLACGMFLAAVHNAGLVALTHTPSPMDFLCEILDRPINERPFLLIPVGFAAEGAQVPDINRKRSSEVIKIY